MSNFIGWSMCRPRCTTFPLGLLPVNYPITLAPGLAYWTGWELIKSCYEPGSGPGAQVGDGADGRLEGEPRNVWRERRDQGQNPDNSVVRELEGCKGATANCPPT